jgi:Zn-finger nucleic acid-binding protein
MQCPRCETSTLDERDRDGVTIDVCRDCRGVWLDRGELEKIIERATRELGEDGDDDYADSSPGGQRDAAGRRRPERKRSWLERLGDIFD